MKPGYLKKILQNIKGEYSYLSLRYDLLSGLSVALLALPQSIAYALLLGLPPEAGIIASISGSLLTSTFGHSRFLIAGPTNATSLLLQA